MDSGERAIPGVHWGPKREGPAFGGVHGLRVTGEDSEKR